MKNKTSKLQPVAPVKKVKPIKVQTVTVHGGGMTATSLTRGGAEFKLKMKLGPRAKNTMITKKFGI